MKRAVSLLLLCAALALSGCGATYHLTRTTLDGAVLTADVTTAERVALMEFNFEGDSRGNIRSISIRKQDAEPVNLTAGVLQQLLGLANPAAAARRAPPVSGEYDFAEEAAKTTAELTVQKAKP